MTPVPPRRVRMCDALPWRAQGADEYPFGAPPPLRAWRRRSVLRDRSSISEHHQKEKGHGPLPRPSRLETDGSGETGPGDLRSLILVSELPGGAEDEARDLLHTLVIHFMRFIANAVVVFVRPREVEDKRDVVLGEVPVIRAAVELVRVIRCVETVT